MVLSGIDVSRHQGSIDWPQVAAAGHTFAWCKATDGVAYRYVAYFVQQAPQIRAAGLLLGAYHWLTERDDPAAQARYFVRTIIETLETADGVLCAVDVERGTNGETPSAQQARVFGMEFHRLTSGHPLFVYSGDWYWRGVLKNPHGADIGPLWHSEYDVDEEVADGPELDHYGGWAGCTVWQFTSSGACPGVAGRCDLNLFHHDLAALQALAGGTTPAPVQEDDEMPAVSLARDPRDGKVYQVVDFTDARHLTDDARVWIAAAYWSAKGVPDAELAVTNWDPADLDPIIAHSANFPASPGGPVETPPAPWPVVSGEFSGTVTLATTEPSV